MIIDKIFNNDYRTMKSNDTQGDLFPVWKGLLNINIQMNTKREMLKFLNSSRGLSV